MAQRYQVPRGTQDILPESASAWQHVEGAFREVCHRYGYREVRTPVFEEAALFARGIGDATDIVSKEMYSFEDRGGRTLALRPEGTAGIARAFIQHGLAAAKSAWKVYYIISIFRYERPQAGRYRQSHQVGVECFGAPGPDIDAEVIALNMAWYQDLGVRGHHLSLSSLGCPACRPEHRVALRAALRSAEAELCDTCRSRIDTNPLRVFDCKSPECQALLADAPSPLDFLCPECEEHLAGLRRLLDDLGLPYDMDRRLVRGLDYYSRTAWEVRFTGLGAQDALAGGGRYDGLVEELGGPATPGIGFAAGIERALITLERIGGSAPDPLPAGVFLSGLNPEARHRCAVLAERLRALGVRAETDLFDRGLKAQLRLADKLGAGFAVLVGEDELASGQAVVRDLAAREQQPVPLDQVPEWVAARMR